MVIKFRAECYSDIIDIVNLLPKGEVINHDFYQLDDIIDIEGIMELKNTSFKEIKKIIKSIPDCHIIINTLQEI